MTEGARRRGFRSKYSLPIALQAVVLCALMICLDYYGVAPGPGLFWTIATLASFSMGVQNATITRVSGAVIRTTHLTGVVTDMGIEGVQYVLWLWDRTRARRPGRRGRVLRLSRRQPNVLRLALLASMGAYALGAAAQAGATFINLDDTMVALIYAFVARALATYWILGVTLGTLYYVVPRATLNGLASGGLAFTSWLLWAGLGGLSAIGALVDPSVPFVVTQLGNVGTMLLVAPVFLTVATLGMTLRGRWSLMLSTGAVSLAVIAMAFLVGSTLLEAIGALRSVQGLVRGTEWAAGASLLGTLGAATFAFYAFAEHAAPRMFRRDWAGTPLTDAQLWATFAGTAMAALALIGAGIAHGAMMAQGAPGDQVSGTLIWFRMVAAGGLGLVSLGGVCLVGTLFLMYTKARRAEYAMVDAVPAAGQ